MRGSVITVATLTTAVYEIESAVSPFAILVIMLEVTPPGLQASIIKPTATGNCLLVHIQQIAGCQLAHQCLAVVAGQVLEYRQCRCAL